MLTILLFEQVAWIAFVKRRGVSPLGAGQWQAFLAFYAGEASATIFTVCYDFVAGDVPGVTMSASALHGVAGYWTIQHFVRPLRCATVHQRP